MTIDRSALSTKQILDRYILPKIAFEPNSGCWIWTGHLSANGYGTARLPSAAETRWMTRYVSHVVYEASVGQIPDGLQLLRRCKLRCCVNPDHGYTATPKERVHRTAAWKRYSSRKNCSKGHAYTKANTYITKRGKRQCRTCQLAYQREHANREKAKDWQRFGEIVESIAESADLSPAVRKFYVYHLIDPLNGRVFYVGKGSGGRVFQHEREFLSGMSMNPKKDAVIRSILARGDEVQFLIVQRHLTEPQALWLERLEIDRLGIKNLTNRVSGTIPGDYRKLM